MMLSNRMVPRGVGRVLRDVNGVLRLLALFAFTASLTLAPTARAQDINWIDPLGGGFQDNLNWSTQTVPGAGNSAVFNLSNAGYSVLFSAAATNAGLRVLDDVVTLDLDGFQYTINTTFSLTDAAGQTARLTIKNGTLQANGASGVVIGSNFSDGTFILSGTGTLLLATHDLHVGGDTAAGSTGALTVENEAVAQPTGGLFVGRFDGNLGTVTVTGAGSAILVDGSMNVGLGGTSLLTVTDSGLVSERNPEPFDVGPFGVVDVTGGGILRTGGTITPGGLSTIGAIGTALGGTAEVNVLGSGSRWELTGPASIGELCPALLMVDNGGLLDSQNPTPFIVGPLGTVDVQAGSILRSGGSLTPGGTTTIGAAGGGTATVNITGVAARWETFGPTNIGTAGDAVVIINSGGFFETKNPTPFIVGPGGLVPVGPGGTLITGGTALNPGGTTTIGAAGVGTATVNVDGVAALWEAFGPVNIGTAGDAAVSITGGGSLVQAWNPDPWDVGPDGLVTVSTGGSLTTNGPASVGTVAGGTATVNVTDAASQWIGNNSMAIGTGGPGTLTINSGGLVESRDPTPWDVGPFGTVNVNAGSTLRTGGTVTPGGTSTLGTAPGGTATATVGGAGALWETFGPTNIGTAGPGTLTINSGGLVESRNPDPWDVGPFGTVNVNAGSTLRTGGTLTPGGTTTIGTAPGGTATATVGGAGALWETFGPTNIGTAGPGTLTISSGGLVEHKDPEPYNVGSFGTVNVNAGSTLRTGGTLTPGGTTTIGTAAGGTATATISGAGALWETFGPTNIGTGGPGQLTINSGGVVSVGDPTPYNVGPFGTVNVNAGATLRTGGTLTPGGTTTIGTAAGGTAILFVGGAGARWEISGPVSIGQSGQASLAFSGGGVVEQRDPDPYDVGPLGFVSVVGGAILRTGGSITPGGTSTLGTAPGGTAQLFVTGAGSRWELFGPTNIGTGGPGTLTINSGGLVSERNPVPLDVGPFGTVNVNAGATLRTGGTLTPGGTTTIGTAAGGTAILFVGGAGARWEISGPVSIGQSGQASLAFSGGGVVEQTDPDPYDVGPLGFVSVVGGAILRTGGSITPGGTSTLGTAPGGTAQLFVTGTGSRWELFGPTNIGTGGPGQLTINSGGVVSSTDPTPYDVGPFGTVNVNGGGTLFTGGPVRVGTVAGGTARLNVDGGVWFSGGDVTIGLSGAAAAAADEPIRAGAPFFAQQRVGDEPLTPTMNPPPFLSERMGHPHLPAPAPDAPPAAVAGSPFVGEVLANGASGTFLEISGTLTITDGGSYAGTAGSAAAGVGAPFFAQQRVGDEPLTPTMNPPPFLSERMGHPHLPAPAPDAPPAAMAGGPFVGEVMANGASGTFLQISGTLTITDGGSYRGTAGSAAVMTANSAEVSGGGNGGQMILSSNMSATIATSMRVDGTALPCGPLRGCTPPILRMADNAFLQAASMDVLAGRVELSGGSITIIGPVTIDDGGAVVADSANPFDAFTATGSIAVNSTGGLGGRLEFGGAMESNVGGNLTISGCGGALRGCTPPILRVRGTAVLSVAGDFGIGGSAQVNVTAGPTFNLAGNFFNFSTSPTTFDWSAGSLTMNGVLSQFELAGENRGVNPSAFVDNFAIGTVRIAPGSIVEFSDLFDNVPGAGCEALYVDTLSLGVGSVINVNSCLVYYQNLVIDPGGATILTGGGGALVCLTPGDLNCDGLVDLNDAAAMVTALIDPAADPQATAAANLNGDGVTDGDDIQTMVNLLLGL